MQAVGTIYSACGINNDVLHMSMCLGDPLGSADRQLCELPDTRSRQFGEAGQGKAMGHAGKLVIAKFAGVDLIRETAAG